MILERLLEAALMDGRSEPDAGGTDIRRRFIADERQGPKYLRQPRSFLGLTGLGRSVAPRHNGQACPNRNSGGPGSVDSRGSAESLVPSLLLSQEQINLIQYRPTA